MHLAIPQTPAVIFPQLQRIILLEMTRLSGGRLRNFISGEMSLQRAPGIALCRVQELIVNQHITNVSSADLPRLFLGVMAKNGNISALMLTTTAMYSYKQ